MIAQLRGKATPLDETSILVDVSGVGYEVLASEVSKMDLLDQTYCKVLIYTHVREDLIQLFGFSTLMEKQLFLSLIRVNGIGPKMALAILSASTPETLLRYIDEGNVKGLSSLPKIGKKKAEQIVLSLKGKLVFAADSRQQTSFLAKEDICSALVHLGFKPGDVNKVVEKMDPNVDVQSGIRVGLAALSQAQN